MRDVMTCAVVFCGMRHRYAGSGRGLLHLPIYAPLSAGPKARLCWVASRGSGTTSTPPDADMPEPAIWLGTFCLLQKCRPRLKSMQGIGVSEHGYPGVGQARDCAGTEPCASHPEERNLG